MNLQPRCHPQGMAAWAPDFTQRAQTGCVLERPPPLCPNSVLCRPPFMSPGRAGSRTQGEASWGCAGSFHSLGGLHPHLDTPSQWTPPAISLKQCASDSSFFLTPWAGNSDWQCPRLLQRYQALRAAKDGHSPEREAGFHLTSQFPEIPNCTLGPRWPHNSGQPARVHTVNVASASPRTSV